MELNQQVIEAIYWAIDEINMQLPADRRIKKSLDTALSGGASKLDSLGLVNLILITEDKIEDLLGVTGDIADQRAVSQENNPYRTISSLSQYITQLCSEVSNDSYQIERLLHLRFQY